MLGNVELLSIGGSLVSEGRAAARENDWDDDAMEECLRLHGVSNQLISKIRDPKYRERVIQFLPVSSGLAILRKLIALGGVEI